jgi:Transposase DDE domain
MDKCIKFGEYMRYLLDEEKQAEQGSKIVRALLEAQSPRLSQIAEKMMGKSASCYKAIQRFLNKVDLKQALLRFYQEEAEYVIGDPTEMVRYRAPKTSYVGKLSDGEASGYWLMVLATAFRGRAIPFSFITYSSRTIGDQVTSRNQEHFRCFEAVKQLLGERPLVLDREFSYAELMETLYIEHIQFVIRLSLGDQHKQPRLIDADGQPIKLFIRPGETVIRRQVYYLGTVKVNLIGYWRKSLSKPLWIMTTLEPQCGLEIYFQRMKIEQTFRDCKDLLHLPKLMNKKQRYLEQMIALSLIAFTIGLWIGEAIRDVVYGGVPSDQIQAGLFGKSAVDLNSQPKWLLYSGLFVLLKQKLRLSADEMHTLAATAASAFACLIYGNVRSFV